MDRMPWVAYAWPGLPQLCSQSSWSSLAVAAGFAVAVNLTLSATLLWSELLTPGMRTLAWGVVVAVWIGSAVISYRWDRRHGSALAPNPAADGYEEALDHYLKGEWLETEQTLARLLRRNPRDADAGLLLATLWRHTGRLDEAARQLDRLECLDAAVKWAVEIGRERQLLAELGSEPAEPQATADEPADGLKEAA